MRRPCRERRGTWRGSGRKRGGGGRDDTCGAAPNPGWRVNSLGEHRCFNCGVDDHWASECPHIADEQQAQLHMMQEMDVGDDNEGEQAVQHFQKILFQADESKVVYLDS